MRNHEKRQQSQIATEGARHGAVLYARVSSKEQELGYSIAAQQELLQGYAGRTSMVVEQEFLDAETAKTTGRRGFAAMIAYLRGILNAASC
jgi:DNA invertase Pin-like site-specific DNA recombinase